MYAVRIAIKGSFFGVGPEIITFAPCFRAKQFMSSSTNIIPQDYHVSKHDRRVLNKHRSCIVWFTGLSGSGKSTLANGVEQRLHNNGIHTYVLDGDNIRNGLNSNVDFSPEGRNENIRRIGEVSRLFVDAGVVVI